MRLSRKAFTEWLYQHEPHEIVGYAVDAERCPLATYLREIIPLKPGETLEIYPEGVFIYNEDKYAGLSLHDVRPRPLPDWAIRFDRELDKRPPFDDSRAITRDDAVTLLTSI
jgi:hypothetical protein